MIQTVEEEIAWVSYNYNLKRPLLKKCIIIALRQKIKKEREIEQKEFWSQVLEQLNNLS